MVTDPLQVFCRVYLWKYIDPDGLEMIRAVSEG
jgi:hypothetical protein